MTRRHYLVVAVAACGLFVSRSQTAQAQGYAWQSTGTFAARRHVDDLAYRLWQDANSVCWEMYRNYGNNRGFPETYREMYRAMRDARHIHDLVHDDYHLGHHDADHIARDLHEIDALFHHIEDDVRGWRSAYRGHHSYHHDHGHFVHGDGYRDELQRKMRQFESTLHHLMADYGVKSQLNAPAANAPQLPANPATRYAPGPTIVQPIPQ